MIVLFSASSRAQQQSSGGDVHGTVTDSTGAVVPNATVTITDTQTEVSRITLTTSTGSYQLFGLAASTYRIKASARGFKSEDIPGIRLAAGRSLTLNLTLKIPILIIEPPLSAFVEGNDRSIWERSIFVAGGPRISSTLSPQAAIAGVRIGKVLTESHFSGWYRGELEIAGEAMPLYELFTPSQEIYGASFKPGILRWDFTRQGRLIPYASLAAGILFTTSSEATTESVHVTFTPSVGGGVHWFRHNRSVDFGCDLTHVTDAAFGMPKAGGFGFVFSIGYSWFKRHSVVLVQTAEPSPAFAANRLTR